MKTRTGGINNNFKVAVKNIAFLTATLDVPEMWDMMYRSVRAGLMFV